MLKSENYDEESQKTGFISNFSHEEEAEIYRQQEIIQNKARFNTNIKRRRHMGHTCGFVWVKNEPLITLGPHACLYICTLSCFVAFGSYMTNYMKNETYQMWGIIAIII